MARIRAINILGNQLLAPAERVNCLFVAASIQTMERTSKECCGERKRAALLLHVFPLKEQMPGKGRGWGLLGPWNPRVNLRQGAGPR